MSKADVTPSITSGLEQILESALTMGLEEFETDRKEGRGRG